MTFGAQAQLGESFVGEGVNAAHINTALGRSGGVVEAAWVSALATPRVGHTPFVAVLVPGVAVKPFTLFVNKAAIEGERHAQLSWGAAQAGVAAGVADAVAERVIPIAEVDELRIVVAVWVNPAADDEQAVFANNSRATRQALEAGVHRWPAADAVLAARRHPSNAFFAGPR